MTSCIVKRSMIQPSVIFNVSRKLFVVDSVDDFSYVGQCRENCKWLSEVLGEKFDMTRTIAHEGHAHELKILGPHYLVEQWRLSQKQETRSTGTS